MSEIAQNDEAPTTIDPENRRREQVRYFRTAATYSLRMGLTADELKAIVDDVATNGAPVHGWVPEGYVLVALPELRDKGVSDMRGK